jgi:hypothetical protein
MPSNHASPQLQPKTKDASNDDDLVPGDASTDDDVTNEKFGLENFVDATDMEQATTAMQCR